MKALIRVGFLLFFGTTISASLVQPRPALAQMDEPVDVRARSCSMTFLRR